MVFSQYLLRPPFSLIWHIKRLLKLPMPIVFYCPELIDYYAFAPVLKHLNNVTCVSPNPIVRAHLSSHGIQCKKLLLFPKAVIMCRHATHKFPCKAIVKIGLRHGAYHFKKMTKAANYNQFDLYMFSSAKDLEAAQQIGVSCGKAIGFPKLDPALRGEYTPRQICELRKKYHLDDNKSCLFFCATWAKSGMSAIQEWYDKLASLSGMYNILVSVHPWTPQHIVDTLCASIQRPIIDTADTLPLMTQTDVCIGDSSSMLAEFCALDIPIITFKTHKAKRRLDEIDALIAMFSLQISSFNELPETIQKLLNNPGYQAQGRESARQIMFDNLDGSASAKAVTEIIKLIPSLEGSP